MSYGTVQAEKMTTESGYSLGAGNASSFKNRIINGAMVIDQRNAGAAVTASTSTYVVDRWDIYNNTPTGVWTGQRSTTAPAGFSNSFVFTVSTAYTMSASYASFVSTKIEGYNIADFNWGTANAKTITISFWIRSSVTGTYSCCVFGGGGSNRNYPATYTINSANTWEYKTITVPGDTSGTWDTTNGSGIWLIFSQGCGSNRQGTANAWGSGITFAATGETQLVATAGATWYLTGVQLEVGTVATSFDYRPYGTELALCQRYCWVSYTTSGNGGPLGTGAVYSATLTQVAMQLPVSMRTTPSATTVLNGSSVWCQSYIGATGTTTATAPSIQTDQNNFQNIRLAVDGLSGMTAGQASWTFTAANAKLILSAEL